MHSVRPSGLGRWLIGGLLLLYFALGLQQVRQASLTFDEGPHLAVGYATLRTGDFRLQPVHIHPPLANVLAAAPLLLDPTLPDPRTIEGWEIASLSAVTDAVVWQNPHPARLATAGRVPILLLGVLLGALVYRWARERGGRRAGLLALTLCALDPNLIAHGALITTDMAATFFSVATLYALDRQIRQSTAGKAWRQTLGWSGVGVLLGLAQLAKVSSLLLVPVVAWLVLAEAFRASRFTSHASRFTSHASRLTSHASRLTSHASRFTFHASRLTFHALRLMASIFFPAGLVLWAGYGFQVLSVPGLPFPLPAGTHWLIYRALQEHYTLGHPTFLLGQVSTRGWWWYFPVAFALKTPLPVLLLAAWAVGSAISRQRSAVSSQQSAVRIQPSAVSSQPSASSNQPSRFTLHVSRFTSHVSRLTSHVLRSPLLLFPLL